MKLRTIPSWASCVALIVSVLNVHQARGQGLNNLWMGGYDSEAGLPFGGTDLQFQTGTLSIAYVIRGIDFKRTAATITDTSGNLLFSTNGSYIANMTGDTMLNGTGLNPSNYTSLYPEGLYIPQAVLILPKPGAPGIYYLFHGTIDDQGGPNALYLYLTTIDMNLDGGLGGVTVKNQILISDALNNGKITAVKHANGRDWWVLCHKLNSSTYYKLLVTPDGAGSVTTQNIGVVRPPDGGQVCFSPDGSKFAYYWGEQDLDIFDFDRCTGLFSNPVHIDINDQNAIGGVAFSPNSHLLYVPSLNDVYQFDVTAPDIAASMIHIAEWDSFYSPSPPFATLFDIAQLAPDGKIYIGTGNSTFRLHVINYPDLPGLACDIVQHGVTLPTYFIDSCPNHPNYHLGQLPGSPCDTLGLGVPERPPPLNLSAYPNPSSGSFALSYAAQSTVGELVVRDLCGRVVLQERIPQWSTLHDVALIHAAGGLYQCTMRWGKRTAASRIIVTP